MNPIPLSSSNSRLSFRRRRVSKWKIALWTLAVLILAVPLISAFVAWNLTHPAKKPLEHSPEAYGLAYETVEFASFDGTKLRGWWLPAAQTDRVVIMAHGFRGNRAQDPALPTAKVLVEQGISVLQFDFRNSGESEGELTTVGLFEKEDLLSAVSYVQQQGHGANGIGLLGFSMGASTALMAAADSPAVEAVVADSPFADLHTYLGENMPHWTHLPDFPFTSVILWELPYLIGHDPKEVSPIRAVDRLRDRPILFIHGDGDTTIANSNSERLVEALAVPTAQLWAAEKATHVGTYKVEPEAYTARVAAFFAEHLGQGGKGKAL